MKRIAIMGARGFVGRNLTEFFQDKYAVFPVTRDDFSLLEEDKVKNYLEKNKINVVFNCANSGGSRKNAYQENGDIVSNNLRCFFNIERCLEPHMKLINFGSGAQYDKKRDLVKVSENGIGMNIPKDDYGYSKYVMSKYINKCSNIYNPIIFGLFGKYEDYTFKFISNGIIKNILKMPIVINQNVIFDYLYMDDFLNIIELLIENDYKHKEFNITPVESIDLLTVTEYINMCSSYQSDIIVKNAGMNYQYTGRNERLSENIGKYRFLHYRKSIELLYEYYLENISQINVDVIKSDDAINYCKLRDSRGL